MPQFIEGAKLSKYLHQLRCATGQYDIQETQYKSQDKSNDVGQLN